MKSDYFRVNRTHRVIIAALLVFCMSFDVIASVPSVKDTQMANLIEKLTSRRSDDLTVDTSPAGILSIDLKERFQHVMLVQMVNDDLALSACVDNNEQADAFFGRNLRTGATLSQAARKAHDEMIEAARLHGMSPQEYQYLGDLIDQAQSGTNVSGGVGTNFQFISLDGVGEGTNSTAAPLLPAPGNAPATLGEQRTNLLFQAGLVWSNVLDSELTFKASVDFKPLDCVAPTPGVSGSAVLGSAGSTTVHGLSINSGPTTLYNQALTNKLLGYDINEGEPDIRVSINSVIDTGCLGPSTRFYYGIDNLQPAGTINLFLVMLHELGHGLGFSSFTNAQTGEFLAGFPDVWADFLFDRTVNKTWLTMTDLERQASAINNNNLLWDGESTRNASSFLTSGREAVTGRVEMYTPSTFELGSSVSHFNTRATPNLLMEPILTPGLPLDLDLTRQAMRDIGWFRDSNLDRVADIAANVLPNGGNVQWLTVQNITWTTTAGFNRNISIDLSVDGGMTYPVSIAQNISNLGFYPWTVPVLPTTQARIRIREYDYLPGMGQSSANFTISGNSAPVFAPAAPVSASAGGLTGSPVVLGIATDAESSNGSLIVTSISGGTATGVTVGNINNVSGIITGTVTAACVSGSGTKRLQVSDGDLLGSGDLQVNITPNSEPSLGYAAAAAALNSSTILGPQTALTDNGSVDSVVVQNKGSFTGTATVDGVGNVTLSNAQPVGTHNITIRATDNCDAVKDALLMFTVDAIAPDAPVIGVAVAGIRQASVVFTPPASDGGASITSYTATASPGGATGMGVASPITVTGLSSGETYTFTVTATNSAGTGPASAPSNQVVPLALPDFMFNSGFEDEP